MIKKKFVMSLSLLLLGFSISYGQLPNEISDICNAIGVSNEMIGSHMPEDAPLMLSEHWGVYGGAIRSNGSSMSVEKGNKGVFIQTNANGEIADYMLVTYDKPYYVKLAYYNSEIVVEDINQYLKQIIDKNSDIKYFLIFTDEHKLGSLVNIKETKDGLIRDILIPEQVTENDLKFWLEVVQGTSKKTFNILKIHPSRYLSKSIKMILSSQHTESTKWIYLMLVLSCFILIGGSVLIIWKKIR